MNAFTVREAIRESKTRVNKIEDNSIKDMLLSELEVISDAMDDRTAVLDKAYVSAKDIGEQAYHQIKKEEWEVLTEDEKYELRAKEKRSKETMAKFYAMMDIANGPYGSFDGVIDLMKDGKK